MLPIASIDLEKETHILIRFTADILEENIKFDEDEILEVKWIEIEEIKKINTKTLEDLEQNRVYPLDIFDNAKYTR